ncbi:hypothetical protein GCM10009624_19870 [Gordonia sinesedis]
MAPLSLAGTVLQPHVGIDYSVFPLVMLGPAIAALICVIAVPRWFPPPTPHAPRRTFGRSVLVATAASMVFVAVLIAIAGVRDPILPEGWPAWAGVIAVAVGLTLGSWFEEVGYRGVLYRAFVARFSVVTSIVVNGVFFGLCHLQYFSAGPLPVVLFLIGTVAMDVVMVASWAGSWPQRVAVATGVHAVVNVSMQYVGVAGDRPRDFVALAVALLLAAVVAVPLGRRLGVGDLRRGSTSPTTTAPTAPAA